MKRYELTRNEANRYQKDPGGLAEELVAQEYRGFTTIGVENFDVSRNNNETLGEVKSTASRLGNGAKGRFRLWKNQHEKLLRYDNQYSTYYVFVLFDVGQRPPVARMKRQKPADVGNVIGGRGGWNRSGHTSGRQYKLPYEAIF